MASAGPSQLQSASDEVRRDWARAGFSLSDPLFSRAVRFKETFEPLPDGNYEWVGGHAKMLYAHYVAIFKSLNDKANSILGYLGAWLTLLAGWAITQKPAMKSAGWFAPCVIAAIAAMICALMARRPNRTASPPSVSEACQYVDYFGDKAEAAFLGQWELCIVIMRKVSAKKAHLVNWAIWLFFAAVLLLFLPFLVTR
jgi:hypothetical protein